MGLLLQVGVCFGAWLPHVSHIFLRQAQQVFNILDDEAGRYLFVQSPPLFEHLFYFCYEIEAAGRRLLDFVFSLVIIRAYAI